jgi:hypothetical protein
MAAIDMLLKDVDTCMLLEETAPWWRKWTSSWDYCYHADTAAATFDNMAAPQQYSSMAASPFVCLLPQKTEDCMVHFSATGVVVTRQCSPT